MSTVTTPAPTGTNRPATCHFGIYSTVQKNYGSEGNHHSARRASNPPTEQLDPVESRDPHPSPDEGDTIIAQTVINRYPRSAYSGELSPMRGRRRSDARNLQHGLTRTRHDGGAQ